MSIYYPTGCAAQIPGHVCDPCEDQEKARVGSVAFIKSSFAFSNPSNPVEWRTGINNGSIIVIPNVNGSFDGGSEVEGPGYGRQATRLTGFNFTSNFKDPNYTSNGTFYSRIKSSRSYRYAFVSETQVHITDDVVSVIPKNPITENPTDDVVWDVTVKWADGDAPLPFDVPPGIFGECFEA